MKKIDLGQAIGILANVGVLFGLILVAVQINQNSDIAGAQLANDYYLADMQLELSVMGDDAVASFVKAVYDPGALSQEDAAILDRYFNYGLIQVYRLDRMRELGLADDELVDWQIQYLKWHLGNEAGRRWWTQYRVDGPDDRITELVDAALREANFQRNEEFLNAILQPVDSVP